MTEANHQKTKIKLSGIGKITINVGDLIGPELKEQLLAIAAACDDTSRQLKALCGAAPGEETQSPPAGGDGADEQGTQPAFPSEEHYPTKAEMGRYDHPSAYVMTHRPIKHWSHYDHRHVEHQHDMALCGRANKGAPLLREETRGYQMMQGNTEPIEPLCIKKDGKLYATGAPIMSGEKSETNPQ